MTTLDIFNFGEHFKDWINILLGMNEGTNFQAVTVINGNISRRINVKQGCRQGNTISGYLFIMAIEILALLLKKSKVKPFKTWKGNGQLLDIDADNLRIYVEFSKSNKILNENNVQEALTAIKLFLRCLV